MKKFVCALLAVLVALSSAFVYSGAGATKENTIYDAVEADAFMLVSLNETGHAILAQRNENKVKYPASLTKVATAMVVIDRVKNLEKQVVVSQSAVDAVRGTGAQSAYLYAGEKVSIEQLLYLAMIHSACDACQVLAESVAGSVPKFVDMMNKWAKSIGCKNTHFVNPDGLHDDNHYSTAVDLTRISLKALKNKKFLTIATATEYAFDGSVFYHTNRMLHEPLKEYYYPYAKGIKTGYTKQAGRCLITMAKKNNRSYLAVILDAPLLFTKDRKEYNTAFFDAKELFEWAFKDWDKRKVLEAFEPVAALPVEEASGSEKVRLMSLSNIYTMLPKNAQPEDVSIEPIDPPKELKAPLKRGDFVCKAAVKYKNKTIGTVNLAVYESVEQNVFLSAVQGIGSWIQGILKK
ncbi:MAG: D-alanyl-D-alanine carboxypeptidase [Clostridia bacterium]|nr:D-alanyl-D-alanine carboxypeptidase [Clostridia bacterium]